MKLLIAVLSFLLLAIWSTGCDTTGVSEQESLVDRSSDLATTGGEFLSMQTYRTYDDRLVEVTKRAPNFAGVFIDETGELVLLIKNYADSQRAGRGSQERLAALNALKLEFGPTLEELSLRKDILQSQIKELNATYDFRQLKQWYDQSLSVWEVPGVVASDIQERINRIQYDVEDEASRLAVLERLDKLGLPKEAFVFEFHEMAMDAAYLNSKIRPVVGGLGIQRGTGGTCTIGFAAESSAWGEGFVTGSHCTNTPGGVENTPFYQYAVSSYNFIGNEMADPSYSSSVSGCPSGFVCRVSDSAFIGLQITSGLYDVGRIARTIPPPTNNQPGTLQISAVYPRFQIASSAGSSYGNPAIGAAVEKIGTVSGWTIGLVQNTCKTSKRLGNKAYVCQFYVDAYAVQGDSGGPVFSRATPSDNETNVTLLGVLSGIQDDNGDGIGEQFIYSSFSSILSDLGSLAVR